MQGSGGTSNLSHTVSFDEDGSDGYWWTRSSWWWCGSEDLALGGIKDNDDDGVDVDVRQEMDSGSEGMSNSLTKPGWFSTINNQTTSVLHPDYLHPK